MAPKSDTTAFLRGFGLAVRARRTVLGLSQEELGFRADFDRTYVSGIERGERNPSLTSLFRLASALEVQVSDLAQRAEALLAEGAR